MPVLVTAADTTLGSALVARLLATGGEVRAWCSAGGDAGALRRAGAIVASGDVDDVGRLEAACEQVHTVVHLGGGLLSPSPERIVADMAAVVEAATNAGVQRLIMLSVVGASPGAPDDLRRAKAEAERVAAEADLPSVCLRTALVVDGHLRELLAGTPLPKDAMDHPVRTVPLAALVEVIWMLDEMRSSATAGHATLVAAGGPPTPLRTIAEQAEGAAAVYRPLDQLPLFVPGLLGPWLDEDPVATDAWAFTGVDPGLVST